MSTRPGAVQHAAVVRTGHGGKYNQRAKLLAAAFMHGTNRNLDPQLHTHVLAFNVAIGEDGKARTIESRHLYQWQQAIGAAFRVALASQLQQLGYNIERDGDAFRLAQVRPELEDEFSTRRKEALAWLRANDLPYTEQNMQKAVLETRAAKEIRNPEQLRREWRRRAAGIELSQRREATESAEAVNARAQAEIDQRLAEKRAVFTEAQAAAEIMRAHQGSGDIGDAVANTRVYLANQAVHLGQGRYTTHHQLEMEKRIVSEASLMRLAKNHGIGGFISMPKRLSREQRQAVYEVLRGDDLSLIQGAAGSGKTTTLKTIVEAYRSLGYDIEGLAPSAKAAKVLADETSIETQTIAREATVAKNWSTDTVYIVDEAGMVSTKDMSRIVEQASKAGAKLILVGDTKQLQAIQAGAPFRAIQEAVGYSSIETTRRQFSEADRRLVTQVRNGDAVGAFQTLAENKRIHETRNGLDAKMKLSGDLYEDLEAGRNSYALAQRRRDAEDINRFVRQYRKSKGELADGLEATVKYRDGQGRTRTQSRELAVGDRIVFTQNVNRRVETMRYGGAVKNGFTGTVEKVAPGREPDAARLVVRLDDGGRREIDTGGYGYVDHAYALTFHKSQGSTYDTCRIYAAADDFGRREAGYVAVSRARGETHIYGDREALRDTAAAWVEEAQQLNALDFHHAAPLRDKPSLERVAAHEREAARARVDAALGRLEQEKRKRQPQAERQEVVKRQNVVSPQANPRKAAMETEREKLRVWAERQKLAQVRRTRGEREEQGQSIS